MITGGHHTEATKRKIAESHRGIKFSPSRKRNMKAAALRRAARERDELARLRARLAEYEQREASA
jgi:hypothetical protein